VSSKTFSFNKYQQALCYFCLFSATFLVVVLQSRTGHLTTLLVLTFISPYLYFKNKKQFAVNAILIIITLFISTQSFDQSGVAKRGVQSYQSEGTRPYNFHVTTLLIKENFASGVGYGNFERKFLDRYNEHKIKKSKFRKPELNLSHPHNEVLYWVSEGGVIALLGMILFFIAYMRSWLKINNTLAKRLAILGLITPLLLHSQLEFPFYSSVSHWFVFIILLWFTDMHSNSDKSEFRLDKTFLLRFLAVLTSVIFVPFLVTTLHTANIVVKHEKYGYQHLDSLNNIVNPIVWQRKIDSIIYSHLLIAGIREKKVRNLKLYIKWGKRRIKHSPRATIYNNLLLASLISETNKGYKSLLLEAQRTYPLILDWPSRVTQHSNSKIN
jgi:O-antigen polymerase